MITISACASSGCFALAVYRGGFQSAGKWSADTAASFEERRELREAAEHGAVHCLPG
jgi:hypothetical protein